MTPLLQKAFSEASNLPPEEQELIASQLLKELASKQTKSPTATSPVSQPQGIKREHALRLAVE